MEAILSHEKDGVAAIKAELPLWPCPASREIEQLWRELCWTETLTASCRGLIKFLRLMTISHFLWRNFAHNCKYKYIT